MDKHRRMTGESKACIVGAEIGGQRHENEGQNQSNVERNGEK